MATPLTRPAPGNWQTGAEFPSNYFQFVLLWFFCFVFFVLFLWFPPGSVSSGPQKRKFGLELSAIIRWIAGHESWKHSGRAPVSMVTTRDALTSWWRVIWMWRSPGRMPSIPAIRTPGDDRNRWLFIYICIAFTWRQMELTAGCQWRRLAGGWSTSASGGGLMGFLGFLQCVWVCVCVCRCVRRFQNGRRNWNPGQRAGKLTPAYIFHPLGFCPWFCLCMQIYKGDPLLLSPLPLPPPQPL